MLQENKGFSMLLPWNIPVAGIVAVTRESRSVVGNGDLNSKMAPLWIR